MKKACIDIGSNSIVLLIGEVKDGKIVELEHQSEVTRLGFKVTETKRFNEERMSESEKVINRFLSSIEKHGVDKDNVFITATEASRKAQNSAEFFDRFNIKVDIISGDEEARLCSLGASSLFPSDFGPITMADIGGMSTEVIVFERSMDKIDHSFMESFPIGVVKGTELGTELNDYLEDLFSEKVDKVKNNQLLLTAGSMTALASVLVGDQEIEPEKINGLLLTPEFITEKIKTLIPLGKEKIVKTYPQLASRKDSIVSGMKILLFLLYKIQPEEVIFSTYGLRHGVLLDSI